MAASQSLKQKGNACLPYTTGSPTPAIWRRQSLRGPDSWKSVGNKKAHDPGNFPSGTSGTGIS